MLTFESINKNIHQVSDLDIKDQRRRFKLSIKDFNEIVEFKTESKLELYKIPIEDFEFYEGSENAIKNLLINHNDLTYKEYKNVELMLKDACKSGDIDLIEILLNEEIAVSGMIFKINKIKRTASLYKILNEYDEFVLPHSIMYDSEKYIITSIIDSGQYSSKKIKILKFAEDTEILTIYKNSFALSTIECLYIPPNLKDLRGGWCHNANKLNKIQISPLNQNFMLIENKYLLGKTDQKSNNFDILLFAARDISEASILPNIKTISQSAFHKCVNLTKVEIPNNSKLQSIGEYSFSYTNIKQIFIPSNVSTIGKYAFSLCHDLQIIKISEDSRLKLIDKYAFSFTEIEQILIPSILKDLRGGWCCGAYKLKKIQISPLNQIFSLIENKYLLGKTDQKSNNFDVLLFAVRNISEVSILPNITTISQSAFHKCVNLTKVEIPNNSNLQSIEECAFSYTNIKQIFIPPNVSTIGKQAFSLCKNLQIIKISEDSNLQSFEESVFSYTNIKQIFIPPNVSIIDKYAFLSCKNLQIVDISKDSKLQSIGEYSFSYTNIKRMFIPPNVSIIGKYAFSSCKNLQVIYISEDSKLQSIGDFAFSSTNIKQMFIPPNVLTIGKYAFSSCKNLQIIELSEKPELQSLEFLDYDYYTNLIIMIPIKL